MTKTKVSELIIIGAGASGLACAHPLQEQKVDLLVLQSRDRIDDRVCSTHQNDNLPSKEFRTEFIHSASPAIVD